VGNKGIQCHGGMGFTWENDLYLYYRRAKASELAFGDAPTIASASPAW
jgi:alkylation response protein AidB-like acyl-CoA dehydrogenase